MIRRVRRAGEILPRQARHAALLAAAVAAAAIGCQTKTELREPPRPQVLDAASGVHGDSGVVRTEFQSEVEASNQVGVHLDLARAHEMRGDAQAAVYEYARAVESASNPSGKKGGRVTSEQKALAHRRMAAALDRLGEFAQAEVHYKTALKLSPNNVKVWNDAGYSAYLQGNYAEAERRLKSAGKLAPRDSRVQTNLGLCLAATGKTDEALEALSQAGGPAVGHANLAYILAAMGNPSEARRHYEIALKFQPELTAASQALAQLDRQELDATTQLAAGAVADPSIARTATDQLASPR